MIIMILFGTEVVIIFCNDIFPLSFLDFKMCSIMPHLGVFLGPSRLSGGVCCYLDRQPAPGENKIDFPIRLTMKNNFHYDVMVI